MTRKAVSPLKKVKRKADYGRNDGEDDGEGSGSAELGEPPQKAMKRLSLKDDRPEEVEMESA